jgi:deoxyribose-phosphate aldolase
VGYTKQEVAKTIDHAVLKPVATEADVVKAAKMCIERGVGCLCVRPCDAKKAGELLKGSACRLSVVIGFPHGTTRPEVKARGQQLHDGLRF